MTKIYVRGSSKRRGYVKRTKFTLKEGFDIIKKSYEISNSINDTNKIINSSPKEKVEVIAEKIISYSNPYSGLVITGAKVIRSII